LPTDDVDQQLQTLTARLVAPEQALPVIQQATEKPFPIDSARYQFTQIVLWAFLIFIVVIVLSIEANVEDKHLDKLTDILKTMLLPLVTLMIGHYFGARSSSS
jgi:hypothetical protein